MHVVCINLHVSPLQSSSDKRFLVKQHTKMLRRQRQTHRVPSAAAGEDAPPSHWKDTTPHMETDIDSETKPEHSRKARGCLNIKTEKD